MAGYIGSKAVNLSTTGADINGDANIDGDLSFRDNDKAIFGAGSDLQIYHSGSHSVIKDAGDGNLQLIANDFQLRNGADNANMMTGANGGAVTLMHNGSSKLATTSTGADITGTLTSDGLTVNSGTNNIVAKFESSDAGAFIVLEDSGSTNDGNFIAVEGDVMSFATGDSERMRLDSSGNVGIGTSSIDVSTQAGGSGYRVLQIESDEGGQLNFDHNDAGTGSTLGQINFQRAGEVLAEIEGVTSGATDSGHIGFRTQATGGALTERMRLDASGNLLVGKTSADFGSSIGFEANSNDTFYATRSGGASLTLNRTTSDGDIALFRKDSTTVGSIGVLYGDNLMITGKVSGHPGLEFGGSGILPTDNTPTNSDGVFNLGSSSQRWKDLYLSGGVIQSDGGKSIFGGGSSIDTSVAVSVQGASNADAMEIKVRTNGKNAIEFRNASNATVGKITANASSTTYATTSDYRLKTDVQAVTNATDRLKQLNPVNFEWIADGTRVDGFLAHEAQAVVPEAVTGTKDAMRDEEYEVTPAVTDDDGNVVTEAVMGTRSVPDYQGIDQSKLVPLLTATLQEALDEITDLKARVATLEAN